AAPVEVSDPADVKGEEDAEVAVLQAKVDKLAASLLRAKADYQNMQRRSDVERANAIRYANAELMRSLLNVIDDFERSLAAAETSDNLTAVVDGVRLVYDNFIKALRDHGLEMIEALHRPFDPNVHEALMQQSAADYEPGTVVEQIAKGYRLGDRVIRPTKVIVSKAPDPVCGTNPVCGTDFPVGQETDDEQGRASGQSEGESEGNSQGAI
ncbi:MAG: nucleotide exchange factor GrpE, partial [Phycisphaerae bacterium]